MIKVDVSCEPANVLKPNMSYIKKIIEIVYENENVHDCNISIIFC